MSSSSKEVANSRNFQCHGAKNPLSAPSIQLPPTSLPNIKKRPPACASELLSPAPAAKKSHHCSSGTVKEEESSSSLTALRHPSLSCVDGRDISRPPLALAGSSSNAFPDANNGGNTGSANFLFDLTCVDLTVERTVWVPSGSSNLLELYCSSDSSQNPVVRLSGFWAETKIETGMRIRVFGPFNESSKLLEVTDGKNFLITEPDILVPCTTVVAGVYCRRKAVLSGRYRSVDGGNRATLLGTLAHVLFQTLLEKEKRKNCDENWLEDLLQKHLLSDKAVLEQLYSLDLDLDDFLQELRLYYPGIVRWIRRHVLEQRELSSSENEASPMAVASVRDIEENIWCPKLGVRGKIDVSLEVNCRSRKGKRTLLPLELKTGKSSKSPEHRGQVLLYNLMLSDLTDTGSDAIEEGLILYLKDGASQSVKTSHHPLRGVLQLRNEMAFYLAREAEAGFPLPEPLNDSRTCSNCPYLVGCSVIQREFEEEKLSGYPSEHAMRRLVPESLAHLTQTHSRFFAQWTRQLLKDWEAAKKQNPNLSEIWRTPVKIREEKGEALGFMKLEPVAPADKSSDFQTRFHLSFIKYDGGDLRSDVFSVGDTAVISDQTRRLVAVFMGFVVKVSAKSVVISVDKKPREAILSDIFRLDRYKSYSSFPIQLSNVLNFMQNLPHINRLRSLVIDREPPQFLERLGKSTFTRIRPLVIPLKDPLKVAILRILMAKDFLLLRYAKPSDRTSALAAIARVLVELGESVLLAAKSTSALDEVLLEISKARPELCAEMLRLGSKAHSECRPFTISSKVEGTSADERLASLKAIYSQSKIVGCPTLQAGSQVLLAKRRFSVALVDEAMETSLSACLPLLFAAEKFVLLADSTRLTRTSEDNEYTPQPASLFEILRSSAVGKAELDLSALS